MCLRPIPHCIGHSDHFHGENSGNFWVFVCLLYQFNHDPDWNWLMTLMFFTVRSPPSPDCKNKRSHFAIQALHQASISDSYSGLPYRGSKSSWPALQFHDQVQQPRFDLCNKQVLAFVWAKRSEKFFNINQIKDVPQPPYSPDVAPIDFCLFGILNRRPERGTILDGHQLMKFSQTLRKVNWSTLFMLGSKESGD
jgi:hypothetical protein